MLVIVVVNFQLGIGEVDIGEDLVFLENVVGHDGFARVRTDLESAKLFIPAHQKAELRLKCRAALAFIKRSQKRIVVGFDDALRVQAVRNHIGQRALADANRAFQRYISRGFEKLGHGPGKERLEGSIYRGEFLSNDLSITRLWITLSSPTDIELIF